MNLNNWKIVTGANGQQYYEVQAQIVLPDTMSNADGVVMIAPESGSAPYTLESVFAMRGQMWDRAGFGARSGVPLDSGLSINVNRWLPDDDPPEPQHPRGRFQNLDWNETP